MPTNDFVPFCNENTGTNLPTQSAYLANPNLPLGNQPGIASSSLNNKAIRQGSTIAAIIAQYVANQTGANMLDNQNTSDHAIPTALLAALTGALKYMNPVITTYTAGSGTHNVTYKFQIASGNATTGATYSDGTTTYTVTSTVAAGTELKATGGAAPAAVSGTLTKSAGTGDATITYYCYRAPLYLRVKLAGGGGGGGGSGTASGGTGGTGGSSTFGSSLLTATGGTGGAGTNGAAGGAGGTGTATGLSNALTLSGGTGRGSATNGGTAGIFQAGASGGNSVFGGAGQSGIGNAAGGAATTNTGGGGQSGGTSSAINFWTGAGGGAGGYVDATIASPLSTYAYAVGAAGTAGTLGTAGFAGGAGASGVIIVEEHYQ